MNTFKCLFLDWKNQKKYWSWILKYSKPYIPKILFMMLIDLSASGIAVGTAVISKKIIDSTIKGNLDNTDIYFYIALTVISVVISVFVSLVAVVLDEKFSFGIRKQVYEKIIQSHYMDIKKYHTGDLMTRLTSDAGNVANGIIYTIPTIIKLFVELILTFCVLFYYEPIMAISALAIAPIAAVICLIIGKKLKKLQVKVQETESAYRSYIQESLANLLVVKSFANEEYAVDRLVELRDNRFYWILKKNRLSVVSSTAMQVTFSGGYLFAFVFGSLKVAAGTITYGTMSLFLTLVNRVQSPVIQLSQQVPKVVSILASAGRVMDIQNIDVEDKADANIKAENIGLEVKDISFGYNNDKVFEKASLSIKPGEFVAILGESGIGKTTLIRLIMSFMKYESGSIVFNNSEGENEIANAMTREFISYVPQGNTLFSGTIRENIRMGKIDATEEEMIEALKMSCAYDFVMELPRGIDTVIGERGHGISEGQAQRLAIARAIVRKAPFLILDEATSALDEQTELKVIDSIQKITPRPTCLVITHRKSILKYVDREISIEDKKIVL